MPRRRYSCYDFFSVINQRWRLIALWLLPVAVVAFLGWQLLSSGGASRLSPGGARNAPTEAPRNAAVARMSYGRFLDYVDAGRVTSVDIFDGGRSAVIEAVDPDLDNRVQRLRGLTRRRPRAGEQAQGPGHQL